MSGPDRQDAARLPPHSLAKRMVARHCRAQFTIFRDAPMSTALKDQIYGLIEQFNKKGADLTDATTLDGDLELDSIDRKSVAEGKSVAGLLEIGDRRHDKKK